MAAIVETTLPDSMLARELRFELARVAMNDPGDLDRDLCVALSILAGPEKIDIRGELRDLTEVFDAVIEAVTPNAAAR